MWPQQRWLVKRATAAIAACSCRRHQILEVLLALILVNCLATPTLPTTHAALITPPASGIGSRSSSINSFDYADTASFSDEATGAEDGDGDAALASFYRSPHRLDGYYTTADLQRSHNYKISPKPCSFGRVEGTCMFVWECIKSEGQHVGMCVDSFMFGSCCAHNYTDNIVLPQTAFAYTRPTKPLTLRPRPPAQPHKPLIRWVCPSDASSSILARCLTNRLHLQWHDNYRASTWCWHLGHSTVRATSSGSAVAAASQADYVAGSVECGESGDRQLQ